MTNYPEPKPTYKAQLMQLWDWWKCKSQSATLWAFYSAFLSMNTILIYTNHITATISESVEMLLAPLAIVFAIYHYRSENDASE